MHDSVRGERFPTGPLRIGQRESGRPGGTGHRGKVKHAWRVRQAVVKVSHDERVVVPCLVEYAVVAPFERESPSVATDAGVKRHGEPPDAEHESPEVSHTMLVTGRGVHLVAQVRGGHGGILGERNPRIGVRKFSQEDFHEPINEREDSRQQPLPLRSLGVATITLLRRPGGALAGTLTFFTFPVIRGDATGTSGRRSRDLWHVFFLLFLAHDASS